MNFKEKEIQLKRMNKILMFGLFVLLMTVFMVNSAQALPTFARKFQTCCTTCHVSVPKLTPLGENFRLNGYQIPEGDEKYLKQKDVSLGAEAWKEVWPNAIWPGAIPGSFPMSAWIMFDVKQPLQGENKELWFDFPHETELLMAGVVSENVPFFAEVEIEGSDIGVKAWLGFYSLFNSNRALNLKIGGLEINPLPMAFDHNRLGKEHFLYNNWRVPGSDNRFRLRGGKMGIELNGIVGSRVYYSAGVMSPDGGLDTFATIRLKLGGTPFNRSAPTNEAKGEAVSTLPTGFWVDNAFELAAFAYSGKTDVAGGASDSFNRLGAGARFNFGNFDLSAAYVIGTNDDPYGNGSTVDANGWHIEGSTFLFPWLIAQAKYEVLTLDMSNGAEVNLVDQKQAVVGIIAMIRANIKLVTEVVIYNEESNKANLMQIRLVFGF